MDNFSPAIAAQIKAVIEGSQNILLHCHPKPDPDSVGGALATAQILKAWGKTVTIIRGDSELSSGLMILPGAADIRPQSFGETDISGYDLFIALDSGGIGQVSSRMPVEFPATLQVVVIDHHVSNPGYGHINLVDSNYPATCALLVDLFKAWERPIERATAVCLLAGIYSDTGGFRHPPTNRHTFETAGALVELVPDFGDILFELENQNDPETLRFDALMLASIKTYFSNQVALAGVDYKTMTTNGILPSQIQSGSTIYRLISVKRWLIGITLTEREPGLINISLRCRAGAYDLARIAIALGGGGHKRAAGIRFTGTLEEARSKLLATIAELYPELGVA